MFEVQPEHVFGGIGAVGGGVWMWSKLRRMIAHDSGDAASYNTMEKTLKAVTAEVGRLQAENSRLHGIVSSLQLELQELRLIMKQNSQIDELARSGKIERRKREGMFDSRTKPGPLPEIPGADAA